MTQEAINQIWDQWNKGDIMAEMVAGVMYYEGQWIQRDINMALRCFDHQIQCGLLWATSIKQYAINNINKKGVNHFVTRCLPLRQGELEQIIDHGSRYNNFLARTIVGVLLYEGHIVKQNKQFAIQSLNVAAQQGCIWAYEFLKENGESTNFQSPIAQNPSLADLGISLNINGVPIGGGSMGSPSAGPGQGNHQTKTDYTEPDPNHDYMKELKGMIGLDRVKKEVESLHNFAIVQIRRKKAGLPLTKVSYHCVFSGSPGTGKTSVARIVAGIYRQLGILKKGHLVEVQRSDLVADYEGQTASKTNKKIDEAIDGVLFIDEAYTLNGGDQDQYGHEAINTLLKRMEDDRERLVVIIAGYSNEIHHFVDTNPGLESRFNRYIHFEDYTAEELAQIFAFNLKKQKYKIKASAYNFVYKKLQDKVRHKDGKFGNARYVRNVFEKIVQRQADRLFHKVNSSNEELQIIELDDVQIDY